MARWSQTRVELESNWRRRREILRNVVNMTTIVRLAFAFGRAASCLLGLPRNFWYKVCSRKRECKECRRKQRKVHGARCKVQGAECELFSAVCAPQSAGLPKAEGDFWAFFAARTGPCSKQSVCAHFPPKVW